MEELFSWLVGERRRVKERASGDRFYRIRDLEPSFLSLKQFKGEAYKQVKAILDIYMVEASSPYAPFIEWYATASHDPISDNFKRDVELLKNTLREYEREYKQREKLVITRSKKHIYISRQEGKIVLSGDTFHVKEELKKKGFKWDPAYKVWYVPDRGVDLSRLKRELEAL
jgi:hypothetical protein